MAEGPVSCDGEPPPGDVPLTPAELAELAELDRDVDPADYELAGYGLADYDLAGLDRDLDRAGYDLAGPGPDAGQPGQPDALDLDGWPDVPGGWPGGVAGPVPGLGGGGRLVAEVLAAGFVHRDGGSGSGPGFGAGGVADGMLPGAVLAGLAGDAWQRGLGRLSDDELVGVALAARRTASWQAGLELAAVTELAARRDGFAEGSGDARGREHFSQELAAALVLTGRGADALLALATGLGRLGQAGALLAAGVIDRARAVVITDELACLDDQRAVAVAGLVLPRAGELTTGQLRAALRRAVLAADPAAAIRRRQKAQKDARVEAWAETAGTAALAGRDLPAAGVLAAEGHIDAAARWLLGHGAAGSLAGLRAAVFLALLAGQSPASLLPGDQSVPVSSLASRSWWRAGRAGAPDHAAGCLGRAVRHAGSRGRARSPGCRDLPGSGRCPGRPGGHPLVPDPHRPRRPGCCPRLCPCRTRAAGRQSRRVAGQPEDRQPGNRDLQSPAGIGRLPAACRPAAPDQDQEPGLRLPRLPAARSPLR